MGLNKADELIRSLLKTSKRLLSTYEIAKEINVSWATANTHCYKLKAFGIIDGKNEEVKIGLKRIVWWIKK